MTKYNKDHHELVCYTEKGHVLRCTGCGGIRVRFLDVSLDLAADDLPVLPHAIAEEKDTVLYIGAARTRFVFAATEVSELNRLLARAQLILGLEDDALSTSLQAATLFSYPMTLRNRYASA